MTSCRTLTAALALFLIVSACGGDDPPPATTDAPPSGTDGMSGELNALLPDDIREAGVIKVGGPVTVPPAVYLEEDAVTRTGYMTDLANAVGDLLGVEIEYIDMPDILREKYQYFTEADMTKTRNAGYTEAPTSLEDGVRQYVEGYLSTGLADCDE